MSDGKQQVQFFEFYSKERLSQIQTTCIENIKRIRQKDSYLSIEIASLDANVSDKPHLKRQMTEMILTEDNEKIYKETVEEIKAIRSKLLEQEISKENKLELVKKAVMQIKKKGNFIVDYNKSLAEENNKLLGILNGLIEKMKEKIEESFLQSQKLLHLHNELRVIASALEKVSQDKCYLKIPLKFAESISNAKQELLRREVFIKIAFELANQIEYLFKEEAKNRDAFYKKYGKYIPKQLFPQLGFTLPRLNLTEMLKQSEIPELYKELSIEQREAIELKYFQKYFLKRKEKEETEQKLKEETAIRRQVEANTADLQKKILNMESKLESLQTLIEKQNVKIQEELKKCMKKVADFKEFHKTTSLSIPKIEESFKGLMSKLRKTLDAKLNETEEKLKSDKALIQKMQQNYANATKEEVEKISDELRKYKVRDLNMTEVISQTLGFMKIEMQKGEVSKLLEYAMDQIMKKYKKMVQSFRSARKKLVEKQKKKLICMFLQCVLCMKVE